MKKIAIFASGSGSNAENIARYFNGNENLNIECIYSNRPDAGVLDRAKRLGIPLLVFSRNDFYDTNRVINHLHENSIDLVVLAGFLWLIPRSLINAFPIINIHPALLPKYGGKGMYGDKVHRAVVDNKEKESGITIHFVNEAYDEGQIIFQARCTVLEGDTPDDVARKVHELEYEYYPRVIENLLFGE
ncbi:MAG TPA: phosphoribosylglycinamide formyltransferase [Prolixibacteraceae bacterium]|nr:phosphoribosylglycinamide formyltransferase [Prolixibacteraceae bacterium]